MRISTLKGKPGIKRFNSYLQYMGLLRRKGNKKNIPSIRKHFIYALLTKSRATNPKTRKTLCCKASSEDKQGKSYP